MYGDSLEVIKEFTYSPGFYKTPWIKNCFANGLSTAFAEPIEGTGISLSINFMNYFLLKSFPKYLKQNNLIKNSNEIQNIFNDDFVKMQIRITSYLHMHYRTNKDDTDFWRLFNSKHPLPNPKWSDVDLPDFLKSDSINNLNEKMVKPLAWRAQSWMSLYAGNMMHNNFVELDNNEVIVYNEYVNKIKDHALSYQDDHLSFLQTINNNKGE